MVLKRTTCDLNGVKIAIFAAKSQKSRSSWGLCPLCDTLELQRGSARDLNIRHVQKTFTFGFE